MKHGSLFTGIGGFDLAASWLNWENIFQVEIDKFCQKILAKNFPNVKRYGDIKEFDGTEYKGQIDIITGGFPCQDISIAGKREGLKGKRSGLFWEMARVIKLVNPKWFVIENVPGLLSSNNGKDFYIILITLEKIGYCVAWRMLDAQYFGVAQRRKRMWIVGSFGNTGSVKVLFEQKKCNWNDKKKSKMEQKGFCLSTRDGERQNPTSETLIAFPIGTTEFTGTTDSGNRNIIANAITVYEPDRMPPNKNAKRNIISSTIRSNDHDTAGNTKPNNIVAATIQSTIRGNTSFIWQDSYIAEINANRKREINGISNRMDGVRGKALGNAIVPQIAFQIFKAIEQLEME